MASNARTSSRGVERAERDESAQNSPMILTKRVFADMVASSVSAILAALEPRALRLFLRAVKIWRVEERALHPGKQTMQRAGPNLARLREASATACRKASRRCGGIGLAADITASSSASDKASGMAGFSFAVD
jgi:hypothetical protein